MITAYEMAHQRLERVRAQAKEAFAHHEITREGDNRWTIRRRHEAWNGFRSEYWAEVAVLESGILYVNGDIDCVVFAYGPQDARSRIAWMANAGPEYATEKAHIGMGTDHVTYDWDHDIALARLREALTPQGEDEPEVPIPEGFDDVDDVITTLRRDHHASEQGFVAWLHEHMEYDHYEGLWDAGRVLSARVVYAQAALARLDALLDAREAAQAPAHNQDGETDHAR